MVTEQRTTLGTNCCSVIRVDKEVLNRVFQT